MRTYLVTGGAGFIGSNYIHYMFRKYDNEIRIINVDKADLCGQPGESERYRGPGELYLCEGGYLRIRKLSRKFSRKTILTG